MFGRNFASALTLISAQAVVLQNQSENTTNTITEQLPALLADQDVLEKVLEKVTEKVELPKKASTKRKRVFKSRSDILEFDVTDDEEDLTDIEDTDTDKELSELDNDSELSQLDNDSELEDIEGDSELEDIEGDSGLEDIEGQVEIDSDEEEHSELTGESEFEVDSSDFHESENDSENDIENFAVGEVKKLEIPEAKPGLSVALEVDTEDGVVKLAEVPSEAVVSGKVKGVNDL